MFNPSNCLFIIYVSYNVITVLILIMYLYVQYVILYFYLFFYVCNEF